MRNWQPCQTVHFMYVISLHKLLSHEIERELWAFFTLTTINPEFVVANALCFCIILYRLILGVVKREFSIGTS